MFPDPIQNLAPVATRRPDIEQQPQQQTTFRRSSSSSSSSVTAAAAATVAAAVGMAKGVVAAAAATASGGGGGGGGGGEAANNNNNNNNNNNGGGLVNSASGSGGGGGDVKAAVSSWSDHPQKQTAAPGADRNGSSSSSSVRRSASSAAAAATAADNGGGDQQVLLLSSSGPPLVLLSSSSSKTTTTTTTALSSSSTADAAAAAAAAGDIVGSAGAAVAADVRRRQERRLRSARQLRRSQRRPNAMAWEVEYLSKEQLTGFDNYKYSAIDTSPLSNYVMHPFWNQCVKLVPRWIAPNCLTFGGFLLNLVSLALLSWYDFSFFASTSSGTVPPVPRWVWLVCAFNQFMAHTLDGIDGKHARRTGLSGPMGELFDHGLDSLATLFMPVCVYSVFGRLDYSVSAWRFYLILWDVHYCFLASHWEKYNTGVLFLPWGYDISQIFLTVTFLLTFVYSHTLWKFTLWGYPSGLYMEFALHFGAAGLGLPVSLWNIYCGYKAKTLRHYSWWEGTRPLVAPTVFFALTTFWVLNSPTTILEAQPRVMLVLIGTLFSNIATRLIINQMTGTRCDLLNGMLALVVVALFCIFQLGWNEVYCLYALTAAVLVGHVHYGVCVVRQMCDHFNINCFSVQRRTPKKIE